MTENKKRLMVISSAVILGLILCLTGVAYAISPPYTLADKQPLTDSELEEYLLARLEVAFGEFQSGDSLRMGLEAEMTARLLGTFLLQQGFSELPTLGVKITQDRVQAGTALKILGLNVGLSLSGTLEFTDNLPAISINKLHLGRIALPVDPLLSLAIRLWPEMPQEFKQKKLFLPLELGDIKITGIDSTQGMLVLMIDLGQGQLGNLDEIAIQAREELERILPRLEQALSANPQAKTSLEELKNLVKDGEITVNPLKLRRLAENFLSTLNERDLSQVVKIIEEELSPELQQFIEDIRTNN